MDTHFGNFKRKSQTSSSMDMTHNVCIISTESQVVTHTTQEFVDKAKRSVLLTRECNSLVEITRYLSYYIIHCAMGRGMNELLPKCVAILFTKCELCKVPLA